MRIARRPRQAESAGAFFVEGLCADVCRSPPSGIGAGLGLDDHEAEDDGEAHERDARGGDGQRHALGHEGTVGAHAHAVEHVVDLDGLEQGLQARRADAALDEAVDDAVSVGRY